jgi:hypothetical protein
MEESVHTRLWVSIIFATFAVAYLLGYNISDQSGTEPGYFLATEAAAYGVTKESESATGMSSDDADYYKSLLDE